MTSVYREFKDGGYLASNGEIPTAGIKYVADLQFRLGLADKVIDPTPLIDDSFRQRAIAQSARSRRPTTEPPNAG